MTQYTLSGHAPFRCLGSACPDSCCVGWDVVIDEETEAVYRAMSGRIGDDLRACMQTDADGDTILALRDGRCPFLQPDSLCRIWTQCGEDALSVTCRRFPRIVQVYDDFTEVCLSLACPEAAALVLTADELIVPFPKTADDELRGLAVLRAEWMNMLTDKSVPFGAAVCRVLRDAANAQGVAVGDGEAQDVPTQFAQYAGMDLMTQAFRDCIKDPQPVPRMTRQTAENLCVYYLYRYVLQAIDDRDVLSKVQLLFAALTFASFAPRETVKNVRLFSKEIEHSYENTEALIDLVFTHPAFSPETFLRIWQDVIL